MVLIDSGKEKVKKICDILKKETLDPAKQEASEIVERAQVEAQKILDAATSEVEFKWKEYEKDMAEKQTVLDSSLKLSVKQSIAFLKQEVTEKLFNPELEKYVSSNMQNEDVISGLLNAIITSIEKEGIGTNISALIPKNVSDKAIVAKLSSNVLDKLKTDGVQISDIGGGVKVHVKDRHMTIDLSDETLKTLISSFISKNMRKVVFAE